ncbi:MAG: protein-tyrosine phosphatase family protein [Acidobacteriota bacterium]
MSIPVPDLVEAVRLAADSEVEAVPFARSYWVVPGRILAGAYPGNPVREKAKGKLRTLIDAGIRCFIDLTSPEDSNLYGEELVPYGDLLEGIADEREWVLYFRMSITDMDVPSHAGMVKILDLIDKAVSEGMPVYVHCLGGFGRTGTVVGCWLVRHGIAQGASVIDLIRKLRRNESQAHWDSPQTSEQRRFILRWKPGE